MYNKNEFSIDITLLYCNIKRDIVDLYYCLAIELIQK